MVGLDADSRKVDALRAGESYIEDVPSASLQAVAQRLAATTHYEDLSSCDAVIICVPTPLTQSREPDLTHLVDSANSLAKVLKRGQLVSLESTTYPGTTRERLRPILEESGLAAGRDFHLAFSPERIDPGRTDYTVRTTPKVVGGLTEECTERAAELYGEICDDGRPRLRPRAGRADEAAREHLPLGQHRPRQRAGDALRAPRDRHLGGHRRRGDQALRLHALRPRARHGRPLPARSTRSTSPTRRASTTSTPSSSSSPARPTRTSRRGACSASSAR